MMYLKTGLSTWELEAWFVERLELRDPVFWTDYEWLDNDWLGVEAVS